MTLTLIFLILAAALVLAGNIWMIVAGFRVSLLWGLLILFIPLTPIVFLFVAWEHAKKPFFCSLAGIVALIPAVALNLPALAAQKEGFLKAALAQQAEAMPGGMNPSVEAEKPMSLEEKKASLVQHATELQAKYYELEARRVKLAAADAATLSAFNADHEAYRALRRQVEKEKAEVEALEAAVTGPAPEAGRR